MSRLTIEKDVNEMGYLEHLCNMTFPKDGEIWYQDGTTICTLRNLIREFAKKMDIELSDHDDDFDGEMYDNLWFVKDRNTLGLLALLNHALIGYDYLRDRLKKYEDLEEQGRLIEQKHGRWKPTGNIEVLYAKEYACSVCGGIMLGKSEFCPNCGAKMDEVEK